MAMVIFLDFDGVLNNNGFFNRRQCSSGGRDHSESLSVYYDICKPAWDNEGLHPVKLEGFLRNMTQHNFANLTILVESLRRIYGDVRIVLSTSWRNAFSVKEWNIIFHKLPGCNFDISGVIPSDTRVVPSMSLSPESIYSTTLDCDSRFMSIKKYVTQHNYRDDDDFFIIIDDDDIFDPGEANAFISAKQYNNGKDLLFKNKYMYFQTDRYYGLSNSNVETILDMMAMLHKPKPKNTQRTLIHIQEK